MIQHILCPIDGSEHADKALALALDLASRYEAKLTLLHVTGAGASEVLARFAGNEGLTQRDTAPPQPEPEGQSASELMASAATVSRDDAEAIEAGARLGERLLEDARLRVENGVEAETALRTGDPARCILDEAKSRGVDMIVMGSRGIGNVRGLLLGSVSTQVGNEAECTCITVK